MARSVEAYKSLFRCPEYCWIRIPKVASNSLMVHFKNLWNIEPEHMSRYPIGYPTYAILRHPVDRFLSGVAFFRYSSGINIKSKIKGRDVKMRIHPDTSIEDIANFVMNDDCVDPHFAPQVEFLPEGTECFRLEDGTYERLIGELPVENPSSDDRLKLVFEAGDIKDRVLEFYKEDYELWKSAK